MTLNDWSRPKSTDTANVITSPSPTQYSKGSPSMLEFLGWKPLEEHRLRSKLSLLYKIEQGIVAIPATVYSQPVTGYTTHIGNLLYHSLESTHIATASFLLPLCCGTHYLLQWCSHKSGRCAVELYHASHLWYPPFYTSPMAPSALQH